METKEHDIVQLMERQQKRKKYHREYMRKTRAKGINKKKPFYVKRWNSKEIEMKYGAHAHKNAKHAQQLENYSLQKLHSGLPFRVCKR